MEENKEVVKEEVNVFGEFVQKVFNEATQIAIDDKEKKLSKEELLQAVSDKVEGMVKEKIGVDFNVMRDHLNQYVVNKAEEIAIEMQNIAPYSDYSKLLENRDDMTDFLKKEAAKSENWHFRFVDAPFNQSHKLLQLAFANKAVDEGEALQGFVFFNEAGKLKHCFVKGEDR